MSATEKQLTAALYAAGITHAELGPLRVDGKDRMYLTAWADVETVSWAVIPRGDRPGFVVEDAATGEVVSEGATVAEAVLHAALRLPPRPPVELTYATLELTAEMALAAD